MSCTFGRGYEKTEELRNDGISWQCVVSEEKIKEEKGAKEAAVSGVWQLRVLKRRMGGAHVERLDTYLYFFGQLEVENVDGES